MLALILSCTLDKKENFGINDAIAEQNVTILQNISPNIVTFSKCFIRTCTIAQFRLGMDKKKNETCVHIIRIDRSVVGNQYVARGSPSVTCEARADSASSEGFKLDSNTDMKENYP